MSKISKMKTLLATLFSLTTVIGCSNSRDFITPEIGLFSEQSEMADFSDVSALADSSSPILVTFNNAYKMLAAENAQIGRKDPKNPDKYMHKLIASAKNTIDGAFYDIDDPGITAAFIEAQNRGVKVRILTDTDNMTDSENPALPRKQIVEMSKAGIEIKEDKRSGIMHQKFIVVDSKTVWTGSMNLTSTSLYEHNNNSLQIQSPQLAENFTVEFNRMFEQGLLGPNPHQIPFPQVNVGSTQIRLFFSPKGGTTAAVMAEIQKAKKSIKFMSFSVTGPALHELITAKKKAGLKIEGVMDDCLARGKYSLLKPFKAEGMSFIRDGNQALLHHKVLILDDETVVTGSANLSESAESNNNENTLIIKSKSIANTYNKEYARVRNSAQTHNNIPWYDNPACGG